MRDDLEGMNPEEPIKWYLARIGSSTGRSLTPKCESSENLAIWCQAIWSGAKGLRTGCPLILFSISQSRHRGESQGFGRPFGQTTASSLQVGISVRRYDNWGRTFRRAGHVHDPHNSSECGNAEPTSMAMRFSQSTRSGTP